eukprot:GEZU01018304.1.p1 GENE.GEZU01018304.1~~GEZU01018304.1.p1  ORF type:complete len:281 (-),score=10.77 GEZU01018304.1:703-1545(-)
MAPLEGEGVDRVGCDVVDGFLTAPVPFVVADDDGADFGLGGGGPIEPLVVRGDWFGLAVEVVITVGLAVFAGIGVAGRGEGVVDADLVGVDADGARGLGLAEADCIVFGRGLDFADVDVVPLAAFGAGLTVFGLGVVVMGLDVDELAVLLGVEGDRLCPEDGTKAPSLARLTPTCVGVLVLRTWPAVFLVGVDVGFDALVVPFCDVTVPPSAVVVADSFVCVNFFAFGNAGSSVPNKSLKSLRFSRASIFGSDFGDAAGLAVGLVPDDAAPFTFAVTAFA